MAGSMASDSGRNVEEGCVAPSVESWCLVSVVVLVGGCCLGSCLPVAREKVVLLRSVPGLDALGMQVVTLASQLGALLVPTLCGLLGCIALA